MVLYFSATGNTRLIAEKIAEKIGDSCVDLIGKIKANEASAFGSEKPLESVRADSYRE